MAWFFTTVGFFSVVRNKQDDGLLVRARVRDDLDALRSKYLPELTATTHDRARDYPYRAKCSHDDFAKAAARIVLDLTYTNFKSEVAAKQGWPRERLYSRIWSVMLDAEAKLRDDEEDERRRAKLPLDSELEFDQGRFGVMLSETKKVVADHAGKKGKKKGNR